MFLVKGVIILLKVIGINLINLNEEAKTKMPFRKEEWICKMAVSEKFYQLNNREKIEIFDYINSIKK